MSLLDWLVPSRDQQASGDRLTRDRLTLAALVIGLLAALLSGVIEYRRGDATSALVSAALTLGFAGLLIGQLRGLGQALVANGLLLLVAGQVFVLGSLSGGQHASLVAVGILPPLAVLLSGLRTALVWSFVTLAFLVAGELGAFSADLEAANPVLAETGRIRFQGAGILLLAALGLTTVWELLRRRAGREAEQARSELARSHDRFEALVERTFDGFAILDASGSLEYLNPAAGAAIGYQRDAIDGVTVKDCTTRFVHPEDAERVRAAYAECVASPGEAMSLQARWQHSELGWRSYEVQAKNMIEDAAVAGVVVNYRDITERVQREQDRLRRSTGAARARHFESLTGLAGGMAHDFNNLLTVVLGSANLLRSRMGDDPTASGHLDDIEAATTRAARITDRMLTYSGAKPRHAELLDLGEFTASYAPTLRGSLPARVEFELDAQPGLPLVAADRSGLEELLENLIENAWEALGDQPGVVRVSTGELEADTGYLAGCYEVNGNLGEGRYAFIEVSDTGAGIEAEDLPRIFEPFYSTRFQGRGMGLAAVLGIARSAKAALRVTSVPGEGTALRVLLPVAETNRRGADAEGANGGADGPSISALVVDDEENVRRVARGLLEHLGFDVETAESGAEGLEALRSEPDRFGLILLDLTMPEAGGLELLPDVRRLAPAAPVVLMSGYRSVGLEISEEQGLRFLHKPFKLTQLEAMIDTLDLPGSPNE